MKDTQRMEARYEVSFFDFLFVLFVHLNASVVIYLFRVYFEFIAEYNAMMMEKWYGVYDVHKHTNKNVIWLKSNHFNWDFHYYAKKLYNKNKYVNKKTSFGLVLQILFIMSGNTFV